MDIDQGSVAIDGASKWLHAVRFSDLPEPVVQRGKQCLLDLLGVAAAAAGCGIQLAEMGIGFAVSQLGGTSSARILFDGPRASPSGAAFAGATLIDSFDAHDGHALTKGHAGVAVLPTLLALLDSGIAVDGPELLASLAMGYEVATRADVMLHASACDCHTSGVWNAVACAAIGARLLRLDVARTREALGAAEYHGPRSQMMRCLARPTMVKDRSGWGALTGLAAAYLAQTGFTGAPAVTVEGEVHAPLRVDLGTRWRILEQYMKPYPVCRWAQPVMEAAAFLVRAHGVEPSRIMHIKVHTFAEAAALAGTAPRTTEEAQYSLPLPLAALLMWGRVGADEIGPSGLADPAILAFAGRVTLVADPLLSSRFPTERLAQVTFVLDGGTILRSALTETRGDAADPLSNTEISAKFQSLAAHLDDALRRRIEDAVDGLDRGGDVPALLDFVLQAA